MMNLTGKYGTAVVYTDEVEQTATSQIINLMNQPMAKGANVRIMPDVHAGAGCVIGFTSKLTDKIVPNLIGVDIGCGVTTYLLGHKKDMNFEALDNFIKKNVPSGKNVNSDFDSPFVAQLYDNHNISDVPYLTFRDRVNKISQKVGADVVHVWHSLGTLGGGNHFLEVDEDETGQLWLTVHSGSRNFGLKVAQYHQKVAETYNENAMPEDEYQRRLRDIRESHTGRYIGVEVGKLNEERNRRNQTKNPTGLEYLTGARADEYFADMKIAQIYARLNRRLMLARIVEDFFADYFLSDSIVESTHNYIDFSDNVIRKGAIRAHLNEDVVIPLTMADGIIIGTGKGNREWNYSAPHGAGRAMSRSEAKRTLDVLGFVDTMKSRNIYTTTANASTIDEAPLAYKNPDKIIELLSDSVEIQGHLFPVYNFKA